MGCWLMNIRHIESRMPQRTVYSHLESVELARLTIEDRDSYDRLLSKCNEQSVLVIEGIFRDWQRWKAIEQDKRVGTTFDLYYCGILFFDKNRYHHHYTINF